MAENANVQLRTINIEDLVQFKTPVSGQILNLVSAE
jgi:hypothetical protein